MDGLCGECSHDDNEHVHYCSHDDTSPCDCNAEYVRIAGEPKDYAEMWLDGGGEPSFDQIDGFLLAHFNARAVHVT
jgi:hypothetical protein